MSETLSWQVGAELCISEASQQQAQWHQALAALDAGQPCRVELDASGLEAVDSAGVQLLLSLKRQLEQLGGALVITAPSTALQQALHVFGLDEQLQPLWGGHP